MERPYLDFFFLSHLGPAAAAPTRDYLNNQDGKFRKLIGFGTGGSHPIDCRKVFRIYHPSYRVTEV